MSEEQKKQIEAAHRFAELILQGDCKWEQFGNCVESLHAGGDLYLFRSNFREKYLPPLYGYGFGFGSSPEDAYEDYRHDNSNWRKQKRWHVWERRHIGDCNCGSWTTEDVVLGDNVPGETLLDALRYCSEHFGYPDMEKVRVTYYGGIIIRYWSDSEVYGHVVNGKEEEQ